jgi:hypothetical protein
MGLEYINRRGERYFVLQGLTKSGKPKYYCARRASSGAPIDQLPKGYEIHERPADAIVMIRKVRVSRIQAFEREQLAGWAGELAPVPVIVDLDGDHLIVYASDTDPGRVLRSLLGNSFSDDERRREWIVQHSHFSPMLRFALVDEDERLYSVQRWCFLGSIDDWISLAAAMPLQSAAKSHLPHVGQESFFELM